MVIHTTQDQGSPFYLCVYSCCFRCCCFIVDGNWSKWGVWGSCSQTCGGGSQMRMRTCTNPPPSGGGAGCSGSSSQSQSCNTHLCVGKQCAIALMHVYVTHANFTNKPRFEIKNKRSFTEMNSQGSRVEKNTHAQKVQMQKILFTNEACW